MTPRPDPVDRPSRNEERHHHGPHVSEADYCPICVEERAAPQLALHAGHGPWGSNDGSVRGVLMAWGLEPVYFIESLNNWGYRISLLQESEGR